MRGVAEKVRGKPALDRFWQLLFLDLRRSLSTDASIPKTAARLYVSVCVYTCMYIHIVNTPPVSQSCVKSCCSYIVLYSLPDRCPFGSVHLSYSANAVNVRTPPLQIHIGSGAGTPPGPTCVEEDYLVRNPVPGRAPIRPLKLRI